MRTMSLLGTSAIAAALFAFAAAGPAAAQATQGGADTSSGTVSGPGTMPPYGMGPGMMQGYGMGPGMMQGYAMHPGMMGPGMMQGYGMGPGMMYGYRRGAGANPAMGGSGYVVPTLDLTTDDVKSFFERWIARSGNSRIKLGKVTEKDANTIEVEIVTKDNNSLVEKYEVARDTGFFHPV